MLEFFVISTFSHYDHISSLTLLADALCKFPEI